MKKIKRPSTGEQADIRDALVTKIKETVPYFSPRLKLIATVLEVYPANAENVYTAGKWTAAAFVHEAMEIMRLVSHLDPEKSHKATGEATMETIPAPAVENQDEVASHE